MSRPRHPLRTRLPRTSPTARPLPPPPTTQLLWANNNNNKPKTRIPERPRRPRLRWKRRPHLFPKNPSFHEGTKARPYLARTARCRRRTARSWATAWTVSKTLSTFWEPYLCQESNILRNQAASESRRKVALLSTGVVFIWLPRSALYPVALQQRCQACAFLVESSPSRLRQSGVIIASLGDLLTATVW